MQKLCTIAVLSGMLFVGNSVGMEHQNCVIDSMTMGNFIWASNPKEFIKENPHLVHAWAKKSQFSSESYPLLHCVVGCDAVSAAQALLEAGDIHINKATENKKHTPLHMVYSKEMAELLLKHGAELGAKDYKEETPLSHVLFQRGGYDQYSGHFSSPKKNADELSGLRRYLLEQGASVNVLNNEGKSFLHRTVGGYSCSYRYPQYILLLLEFGADIEIKDSEEKTICDLAIERRSHAESILEVLRKNNIVFVDTRLLREISWKDENGEHQICKAKNFLELLGNDALEFKRCIRGCGDSHKMDTIKKILADLLRAARNNEHSGKITYYESAGYLFNKVNIADLEKWCGKNVVDYLCEYFKI